MWEMLPETAKQRTLRYPGEYAYLWKQSGDCSAKDNREGGAGQKGAGSSGPAKFSVLHCGPIPVLHEVKTQGGYECRDHVSGLNSWECLQPL